MNAGLEYDQRVPGLNASFWYGSMATSCSHVVGSKGSHGSPRVHGHVGFWNPAVCESSIRIVMLSGDPYGSYTPRSSGRYFVAGSSSDNLPRSRSCSTVIATSVFVIEPYW